MKGVVFVEFIEMVENSFSIEMSDRLIEMSELPSSGIYTSVGTYDPQEMVTLVGNLSALTEIPVGDLLKTFGGYLFKRFVENFPDFFKGITSSIDFLSQVDSYVHLEVRKLYENAELPTFECSSPESGELHMTYESKRNLPDLAEGLILGCIDYYGEQLKVERKSLPENPMATLFIISPNK
ncbi:MAG: heme NO-binding domain-containing protein [Desulfobacteraceae bacterium]|nr:heme NO-binding domain-containing protein [Desulfobacteraceae bacterium]